MSATNNDQFEEENFLFGKDKKNPFALPTDYFDSLSDKLINKIEIIQELEHYPSLSAVNQQLYFGLPQNYFIENENLLEYRYELSALNELSKISKPVLNPLTEGYLEALSNNVLKQIELADELKSYSVLAEIKKENAFAVDPDYFETVADNVKERYHSSNTPKISIVEQVLGLLFKPKMAFGYSIVLIVGMGLFFYFNQTGTVVTPADLGDCKTLACLERKELLNEHTIQNLDEENLYDLVDADQLGKQLSAADSLKNAKQDSLPVKLK